MRCSSVQKRLNTWANEPHRDSETRAVESHLKGCNSCREYRARIQKLDSEAMSLGSSQLDRNLLPSIFRDASVHARTLPRNPFPLRKWVAAGTILVMVFGAFQMSKHGAFAAAASVRIKRMEALIRQASAVHLVTYQAEGENQEGDLKEIEEVWYDNGEWRKHRPQDIASDMIIKWQGSGLVFFRRKPSGAILTGNEVSNQQTDFSLPALLSSAGIEGAESKATDLGPTKVNGRMADKIMIPTYDRQRTFVWLIPGTNLPVRIERQNDQGAGWHASWVYVLDFSDHWPASTFDPSTLPTSNEEVKGEEIGTGTTKAPAHVEFGEPNWMSGNALFSSFMTGDDSAFDDMCVDSATSKTVHLWLTKNSAQFGRLNGYGSYAPNTDDPKVKTSNLRFALTFGKHEVKTQISFRRDDKGIWRVTGIGGTDHIEP